jgi:hypothetical protein
MTTETKAGFTAGPWHIKTGASGNLFIYGDEACRSDDKIAGVSFCYPDVETAKANSALIAASPALFAALQDMVRDVHFLIDEGTLPLSAMDHASMIAARNALSQAVPK